MDTRFRHCLRTIALATLLVMALPCPGLGHVLIVQGSAIEAYQQAVAGFKQAFATASLPGIASIQPDVTLVLDPEHQDSIHDVSRKYQDLQPEIIVAVGTPALEATQGLSCPIVYLMVPNPEPLVRQRPNITGIRMATGPKEQLMAIKETFPAVTRIGLLHNPERGGDFLALAQAAAGQLRLTLVSAPATDDREASQDLTRLAGQVDAILLTPEPSLISQTLLNALAIFSLEQRVPLIAFAPKYLEQGAAMAVFTSPVQSGRQAAELVKRALTGQGPKGAPPEYGHEATVLTNDRIIKKLGVLANPRAAKAEGQAP